MTCARDAIDRIQSLLDPIADEILEMPDQEIIACQKALGLDPIQERAWVAEVIAKHTDPITEPAIAATHRAMVAAQKAKCSASIPDTADERRSLLDRLMNGSTPIPSELTLAFRDGKAPSDRDIEGILEDLADLGYLDSDNGQ